MPNCEQYQMLSVQEKWELIGKVVHAVQNDSTCFHLGTSMINYAQKNGVFEGVEILPERKDAPTICDIP